MGFNFFFEIINNKMGVSQEGQEAIYILLQQDWEHEKIKKAVCLNEDEVEKYLKKHSKETTNQVSIRKLCLQKNAVCSISVNQLKGTGFYAIYDAKKFKISGIMTNNHVLKNKEQCQDLKVMFNFKRGNEFGVLLDPDKFFWTDVSIDVTFVACVQTPLKEKKNIPISISEENVNVNDKVHIYQHPKGRSLERAQGVISRLINNRILYTCDTQTGSSGSPVFRGIDLVALHQGSHRITDDGGKIKKTKDKNGNLVTERLN